MHGDGKYVCYTQVSKFYTSNGYCYYRKPDTGAHYVDTRGKKRIADELFLQSARVVSSPIKEAEGKNGVIVPVELTTLICASFKIMWSQ